MRVKHETVAQRIANAVRHAARKNVYGLRNTRPSAIIIPLEHMEGACITDVLVELNTSFRKRRGIAAWQALEPTGNYDASIRDSAESLTDARAEVTFFHTDQYDQFHWKRGRDPIHVKKEKTNK